jgi:hypothetical protein
MQTKAMSQVRPLLWMIGVTASGFLMMLLLLGTRRGERKVKLSSKDLGTLTEIKQEDEVLEARITNVRVLYVVVEDGEQVEDSLAQRACQMVKSNGALAEMVRIVKPEPPPTSAPDRKTSSYTLLEECNCSAVRIK